jgi:16S rRNA (guanine(966)-N(2))-methyltransferase RsmD
MRVITGKAKGRQLFSVPGDSTRPITDRVKVALFDILYQRVFEALVLDLFAGTGAVGIEALSRGATQATFVECNPRALATLRHNLQLTGLQDNARVVHADVFKFLASYQGQGFDIIHVAPPQYRGLWAQTLQALDRSPLLAPDGVAVAQIHPKEYQPLDLRNLLLSDQRKYGSTLLCFYEAQGSPLDPP